MSGYRPNPNYDPQADYLAAEKNHWLDQALNKYALAARNRMDDEGSIMQLGSKSNQRALMEQYLRDQLPTNFAPNYEHYGNTHPSSPELSAWNGEQGTSGLGDLENGLVGGTLVAPLAANPAGALRYALAHPLQLGAATTALTGDPTNMVMSVPGMLSSYSPDAEAAKFPWLTEDKLHRLISQFGYAMGPERSKGAVGFIRPSEMLKATIPPGERNAATGEDVARRAGLMDPFKFANESQHPFLNLGDTVGGDFAEIMGHEGRARMTSLLNAAGDAKVPIVLRGYSPPHAPDAWRDIHTVAGERPGGYGPAGDSLAIGNVEPLTYQNEDNLRDFISQPDVPLSQWGITLKPQGPGFSKADEARYFDAIRRPTFQGAAEDGTLNMAGGGMIKKLPQAMSALSDLLTHSTAPAGALSVVKPKGGQWLNNSVEDALRGLKSNDPRGAGDMSIVGGVPPEHQVQDAALNAWIQGPLTKYVKNRMASPEDEIRQLADQGIKHHTPDPDLIRSAPRAKQTFEATTPAGLDWERAADNAIGIRTAGELVDRSGHFVYGAFPQEFKDIEKAQKYAQEISGVPELQAALERHPLSIRPVGRLYDNPWLATVLPDTPIHSVSNRNFDAPLGFDHLTDVISNKLADGTLRPENLNRLSVADAVRLAHAENLAATKKAEAATQDALKGNLAQTATKTYDNGFKWVQLPDTAAAPENADLVKKIGEQGGWCTQQDWAALNYGSNGNQLHVLLGPDGRPHAQVQVQQNTTLPRWEAAKPYLAEAEEQLKQRSPNGYTDADVSNLAADMARSKMPSSIQQIKPMENSWDSARVKAFTAKDPEYQATITPMLQDFVRSGQWSDVQDLKNTGLLDLRRYELGPSADRATEQLGHPYVTDAEYNSIYNTGQLPQNFAAGGHVQKWPFPHDVLEYNEPAWPFEEAA